MLCSGIALEMLFRLPRNSASPSSKEVLLLTPLLLAKPRPNNSTGLRLEGGEREESPLQSGTRSNCLDVYGSF